MPGYAYGLSAERCITGSMLAQVSGSVCSKCYALRGNYRFDVVKEAHAKRHAGLGHPQWVDAMVFMIADTKTEWFRWHDSGDLQGVWHLANIAEIARRLPDVKFWLPTREKKIVNEYSRSIGPLPANLVVRVSAAMVDAGAPAGFANTSTVHQYTTPIDHACPAKDQGNKCGACRACWHGNVKNVGYHIH